MSLSKLSPNPQIQAVFFDLGGVVIEVIHSYFATHLHASRGSILYERLSSMAKWPNNEPFERGEMSGHEFCTRFMQYVQIDGMTIDQFQAAWNSMLIRPFEGVAELIQKVKQKGVLVCALSNTNEIHWNFMFKQFPIMQLFDVLFASFELGARKPEKLIFERALKKIKKHPGEVLLIDDLEDNLNAARTLGIHAEQSVNSVTRVQEILNRFILL